MIYQRFRRAVASVGVVAAIASAPTAAYADVAPASTTAGGWTSYTLALTNARLADVYAADAANAWAVGEVNPSPTESTILWRFDGVAWSPQPVADIGGGTAIAGTSASDLWIGGRRGTAHFDGRNWTTYPLPATVTGVVDLYDGGPGAVWAVLLIAPGNQRLARFAGGQWTIVTPSQVSDLASPQIHFAGTGANDLWVRYQSYVNGRILTRLLHWDGTAFTQVQTGLPEVPPNPGFTELAAAGPADAWASGVTVPSVENKSNPYHWNGTSWQAVDDGLPNTTYVPRVAATGTVWAERRHFFEGYVGLMEMVRWVDGRWQVVPGAVIDLVKPVLQYAAAGDSGLWALRYVKTTATGRNTQVIDFYSEP